MKKPLLVACLLGLLGLVFLSYLIVNSVRGWLWTHQKIDKSLLIGNYKGSYEVLPKITEDCKKGVYKGGTHELELQSNGQYTYRYTLADGQVISNANKWKYEREHDQPVITLYEFSIGSPDYDLEALGFWSRDVELGTNRTVRFCIQPDLGFYFVKEN